MDNQKRRKRRRKRTPAADTRSRRAVVVGVIFTACLFGLFFQIWRLQRDYGEDYAIRAARQEALINMDRVAETFAPVRGGFVDRHMQPITGTQQVFTVYLDVEALHNRHVRARQSNPNEDIREKVFDAITEALSIPRWELMEMFRTDDDGNLLMTSGRNRRVLKHEVPAEIAIPLTDAFREVHRDETSLRWYTDPYFAPQVIGFMRGDAVWGLEAQYREELEGQQGRNIWVHGETETIPVRDGYTIVTTLDADIQRLAQHYVDRTIIQHPAKFVGMIVMQPFTGEILAMAQAPTFSLEEPFNPDYFTDEHLAEIWDELSDGERSREVMSLWRNYHTTRSNEPGSTFKPFVIAAAIEEGIITPHNSFHCEGARDILDQTVRCHSRYGCQGISLRRAIYRSCNLAMVDINRMMGRDLFYKYRGYFGFGERTGIDLPGEEDVSSPLVMYPYSMLNTVEMATSSMGQGFNTTTLQIINGHAALINGGNLMRPYLVSQIVDNQGARIHEATPTVVRRVISQETSDYIRNEMRYVVEMRPGVSEFHGTGWRSHIQGHSIGGKTGTAQQGERGGGEYIPTHVAFLPVESPQYLVLLTIDRIENEDNRFAGGTVSPIMREFLLDLIRLKNIQPTSDDDIVTPDLFGTPMPDYSGQRLTDVVRNIINMGTSSYLVVGGGTMISHHWPAPGHPMPENSPIIFYTDSETRISERMATVPDVVGLTADTANLLLLESGFPPVLITDRRQNANDNDFRPYTARPEQLDTSTPAAPAAPIPYTVHQQFPSSGSEIERGTQVIIRAR
jgi:stage V sporulation protein D (sporulation-specific penicillin-binding protein)